MADYPTELCRPHHLFDGTLVMIRPIRAADAPMEQSFVRNLSADARYTRFMGTLNELPASKLRYLTDIDYVRHLALVATIARDGAELEIGVARYVVNPDGTTCEFAIVVDDTWQGSGVAGILMRELIAAARARGLATMEGLVLASNHKMLKFCRQLGFSAESMPEDPGTVRMTKPLCGPLQPGATDLTSAG